MLTAERLRELLVYSPVSGEFKWRVSRTKVKAGKIAGSHRPDGYWWIGIDRRAYTAGRLVWLYMTGRWPEFSVDHRDCDPLNNRWDNLREADIYQQNANQRIRTVHSTGFKGVRRTPYGTFKAHIYLDGHMVFLGTYKIPQDANAAYMEAARKRSGEFARAA